MKSFIILAIQAIAAGTALAAPRAEGSSKLAVRATLDWMKLCTDKNWSGDCRTFNGVVLGTCQNVPADLNDQISSIDHAQPHSCRFFKDINCSGDWIGGNQDIYSDLSTIGFNDVITSWRCS